MTNVVKWRGAPKMHPATFIEEEMKARNWTRDRMAATNADDPGMCRLKLDLYLDVGPTDARLRIGKTDSQISAAFGLLDGFFQRMEDAWLAAQ